MTETIYCANDPCETEALYVTENGTPLCETCHEAYLLGQGSPEAFTYEIDELVNYHAYCERWLDLHGEKTEIWNGREIVKRLNFGDFVDLMEEYDDLTSAISNLPEKSEGEKPWLALDSQSRRSELLRVLLL